MRRSSAFTRQSQTLQGVAVSPRGFWIGLTPELCPCDEASAMAGSSKTPETLNRLRLILERWGKLYFYRPSEYLLCV